MTDTTTHARTDHVRNHWWWRPGWRQGRRFYTWHLTFEHQPNLYALVDAYQRELAELPGVDLIPREWLHLTMQGVGFVDEVDAHRVDDLVRVASTRLAQLSAPTVTFERPLLHPEAILLPASPAGSVAAIRDAIRDSFPDAGLGDAPEPHDGFLPHVSLAYISQDGPAAPILTALARSAPPPAAVEIRRASLIVLDRDHRIYQWRDYAVVPLAGLGNPATSPAR